MSFSHVIEQSRRGERYSISTAAVARRIIFLGPAITMRWPT